MTEIDSSKTVRNKNEFKEEYDYFLEEKLVVKKETLLPGSIKVKIEDVENLLITQEFLKEIKVEPQEKSPESLTLPLDNFKDINQFDNFCNGSNIKKETEPLNTEFVLPTLKNEDISSHCKPSSSKQFRKMLMIKRRKKYPCHVCQINLSYKSRLKHFVGHFGKRFVTCEFCGKLFKEKFQFLKHCFIHLVKSTVKKNIKNFKINYQHLSGQVDTKLWNCEICFKQFKSNTKLNRHIKIHNAEKKFQCNHCYKRFTQKGHLTRHLQSHTGKRPFKCNICFKHYSRKDNFTAHLKIHILKKPSKCDICSKQFKSKLKLTNHFKTHNSKHPKIITFKCDICSKQFTDKSYLAIHSRIHTKEKPFKCDICLKKFTRKGDLPTHLKIHSGEKPFKCETCLKEFKTRQELTRHLKIHTGEKPFMCGVCFKQFIQKSDLVVHLTTHTDEKPFKCNLCLKRFSHQSYLRKHLKIHTNEKSFK